MADNTPVMKKCADVYLSSIGQELMGEIVRYDNLFTHYYEIKVRKSVCVWDFYDGEFLHWLTKEPITDFPEGVIGDYGLDLDEAVKWILSLKDPNVIDAVAGSNDTDEGGYIVVILREYITIRPNTGYWWRYDSWLEKTDGKVYLDLNTFSVPVISYGDYDSHQVLDIVTNQDALDAFVGWGYLARNQ